MTKGYSILSLDSLEKGQYQAKAEIEWNVASDIEKSYNFRIYSPKAVKITDKRGNQGFSLLSLPEVWNQEATFMDTQRSLTHAQTENKSPSHGGLLNRLFSMFGQSESEHKEPEAVPENYKFLDPFDHKVLKQMGEKNHNGPVTFMILKNA